MRIAHRLVFGLALALAALEPTVVGAQTQNREIADPEVAAAHVLGTAMDAAAALRRSDESGPLDQRAFETILARAFNTTYLSHFALGDRRSALRADEIERYEALFPGYIVSRYLAFLRPYADDRISIVAAEPAAQRDAIVTLLIEPESGDAIKAEWRVRMFAGEPKVIDISVDGVSLAVTERETFDSLLHKEGIAALFAALGERGAP